MASDCWFRVQRAPGFTSSIFRLCEIPTRNRGPALDLTITLVSSIRSVTVPITRGGDFICSISLLNFRTSRSYLTFWVSR